MYFKNFECNISFHKYIENDDQNDKYIYRKFENGDSKTKKKGLIIISKLC